MTPCWLHASKRESLLSRGIRLARVPRGIAVVLKVSSPAHRKLLHTVGALDRLDRSGHVASDLPTALAHARTHALRGARELHLGLALETTAAAEAPPH